MRPIVALVAVFLASVVVGGLLHLFQPSSPSVPQPTAPRSPTATPVVSHRPGVYPWESCSAHPNPSCPIDATPGCPKTVAPGLEPFYPHCPF